MAREMVEVHVDEVKVETDKALLCIIDGKEHWIPKSQIGSGSDVNERGDSGVLEIPEWLAVEKKLV